MSEKDSLNLLSIQDSISKIIQFTSKLPDPDAFFTDVKSFDAVMMNFIIIGEMVDRISKEFKKENPQIEWIRIKGFRNLVAHDYFGIDAEEVWQIIFHETAVIQLERILFNIEQIQSRIFYELNFLKYGTPKRRKVTLTLMGFRDAEAVHVSGEFNNWRPDASMLKTPEGWERSYELFPGSYEYKFVIDGSEWILDPGNSDSTYVPEVSNYNSVLYVAE